MITDTIGENIIEKLREVYDPEISINIYDLGLIYNIDVSLLPKVTITHTLTSVFCPAADDIVNDIRQAALSVEGVIECDIITTFIPEFGPEMMSDDAKLQLGFY